MKLYMKLVILISSLFILFLNKPIVYYLLFGDSLQTMPPEIGDIELYFCPKDNCSYHLEQQIKNAEKINCALFDLGLENLQRELKKKKTRLVLDNKNKISSPLIRKDDDGQLMHNKFCIFDRKTVFTGSFNPTERGAFFNNNNMLIIKSRYLAENYEEEFNELWNLNFGKGNKVKYPLVKLNNITIENYFCPEDNCEEKVLDTLKKTKHSIYFMTFTFTSKKIGDFLIDNRNNLEIKGVFEKFQRSKYSQFNRLKLLRMDVKADNNTFNMHHKVFIIDNETVITGSYNPTAQANKKNDENILIIHDKDIAARFIEEFKSIWNQNNSAQISF